MSIFNGEGSGDWHGSILSKKRRASWFMNDDKLSLSIYGIPAICPLERGRDALPSAYQKGHWNLNASCPRMLF
jgi:hypothetical protein